MKRSRPGTVLTALAPPELGERLAEVLFRETTTIGVRWSEVQRRRLPRELVRLPTTAGPVTFKISRLGGRVVTVTPEFEEVRRIADAQGRPVREVLETVRQEALRALEGGASSPRGLNRGARVGAGEGRREDDGGSGHGGAGLHPGQRGARDDVPGRRRPAAGRPLVGAAAMGSRSRAIAGRRPRASAAMAGWLLWVGGVAVQILGQFGMVGVARW